LSTLPSDSDGGVRPIEFEVVEAKTDQFRDAEPSRKAEIEHGLVSYSTPGARVRYIE
jgi:hypothetical protein